MAERTQRIKTSDAFGGEKAKKEKAEFDTNNVIVPEGHARKKIRVGRGPASGCGKTSGRGQKGQKARNTVKRGFEGGQMPLHRRLPKRGFTSNFHKLYQPVNLRDLAGAGFSGEVTPEMLLKKGIIQDIDGLIKVLGAGEITTSVNITADKFSKSAEEKIKQAGGSAIVRKTENKKKAEA